MRTRTPVLILLFSFVFIAGASGEEQAGAQAAFYQGNTHYSEEKFEQAIDDYERALNSGFASGPLYYNLGNAYFKDGKLGKAVLNYLKAKRLMPKDADLKANLNYACSLIKGGVIVPRRNWFAGMFFNAADSYSLDGITLQCSVLYCVLSILLLFLIVSKALRRLLAYLSVLALVLLIISIAFFAVQFNKIVIQQEAVVVVESVGSRFEPLDTATTFFTLYEGECIAVTASKGEWLKVKRPDDRQGWIKRTDIELL